MAAFLKFAETKGETDVVSRLKAAGPADTGSTTGLFVDEWKKIAAEKGKAFEDLQHAFIEDSQFKPAAKNLLKITGYDVMQQSDAVKDVFFSTVVQHGPGGSFKKKDGTTSYNGALGIFKQSIDEAGGIDGDPKKIISNVYKNRANKFGSSTAAVQESVKKRFVEEERLALEMQNNSGSQIDKSSSANRDMKADANAQQPAPVNVNNTYENKKSSPSSGAGGGSDDTNPYEKKRRQ
jgi:hypothetical protein